MDCKIFFLIGSLLIFSVGNMHSQEASMEKSGEKERPRIGVSALVCHNGNVLLGKRKGAHGAGDWALPGGYLEFGETVEECACRELKEETGLNALSFWTSHWTNDLIQGKHHITFHVVVDRFEGTLDLLEPHKCEGWGWFSLENLPTPLFPTIKFLHEKKQISKKPDGDLDQLTAKILAFFKCRDWEQFHSPKNLVMDLASEVGEVVEPFRWLTETQSYNLDEKTLQEVRDEIGDVFKIILYLSHKLGIDPVQATYQKLEKMNQKYPVDACRGKAAKYTAYESN